MKSDYILATSDSPSASYDLGYILMISATAAMGGLLFGYDWVVIGGAKPFYEAFFQLTTPTQVGWAMSSAILGCLIGALVSGTTADKLGRKPVLILAALMFAVTSLGTAASNSFAAFLCWRICGGIAIGLASVVSPMYIAELAPAFIRGRLVALNQMAIVLGVVAAQVANWLIARPVPAGISVIEILSTWNVRMGWRWMFGATAFPALLFLLCVLAVPESPRWFAKNKQQQSALSILTRIGGAAFASSELGNINATLTDEARQAGFRDLLDKRIRRILGLGIFLAAFQQWCGINVVFNYAQEIFAAAGYQVSHILFNIVITGLTSFVFTLVAILTVDSLGRRMLMLVGAFGLSVMYLIIGWTYHVGRQGWPILVAMVVAVASYSLSLAPVTWVLISEIFPNRIRGRATSVAVFTLWTACFVLTYTFPFLNKALGSAGTFWVYAAVCMAGFLVVWMKLPETKDKTLEQIEHELTQ